jgi:hypothetical protein
LDGLREGPILKRRIDNCHNKERAIKENEKKEKKKSWSNPLYQQSGSANHTTADSKKTVLSSSNYANTALSYFQEGPRRYQVTKSNRLWRQWTTSTRRT